MAARERHDASFSWPASETKTTKYDVTALLLMRPDRKFPTSFAVPSSMVHSRMFIITLYFTNLFLLAHCAVYVHSR